MSNLNHYTCLLAILNLEGGGGGGGVQMVKIITNTIVPPVPPRGLKLQGETPTHF